MKTALLLTGSGPLVIATSHASLTDSGLLEKLRAKGIDKFIAYELPLDLVKERYGGHFDTTTSPVSINLASSEDCIRSTATTKQQRTASRAKILRFVIFFVTIRFVLNL